MKKVWYLIGLIMLLVTIFEMTNSYAKYVTVAQGTDDETAGAWVIKVNDSDISSGSSVNSFTINNLTYESNAYIASGKLAPSGRGYFDITFDPSGSSVAVRFDLSIDSSQMVINNSIVLDSAYKVVNNQEISGGMTATTSGAYAGVITLAEVQSNTQVTARFYVKWENHEGASYDTADSALGLTQNANFSIPVTVEVSQYSGETIT